MDQSLKRESTPWEDSALQSERNVLGSDGCSPFCSVQTNLGIQNNGSGSYELVIAANRFE
jgi:hypothetical protein